MLTIHVWPRRLKEFLLTHPLYKSPRFIYRFYAGIMHENYHRRLPTPPSSNPLAEEIAVAVRLDNGNYVA